MFDLEKQVRSWREAAASTLGDDCTVLDELEAHLRDGFDRLTASGQSPAGAWDMAVKTLGHPQRLAGEFAKLQNRVWLPGWAASVSLVLVVALLVCFVIARAATGRFTPLLAAHMVFVVAGYAAVFATGFLGVCAVLSRAISGWSDRQDARLRAAGGRLALLAVIATFIGVALGAWWAHGNLGRWWAWDPKEIGGLCVLAWGFVLLQCFRSGQSTPQSRMCIGVIANMVVAVSWFGPVLLGGLHAYESPTSLPRMLVGGFLVAQILLVYLALLPAGVLRAGRAGRV